MSNATKKEDKKAQLEKATVAALYYYPIKSCAGIKVDEAIIGTKGFEHDRELMVVASNDMSFLTQRELPRMAFIKPEIRNETLFLDAPGMPSLEVKLVDEGEKVKATVWKSRCDCINQGEIVAQWLGEFLRVDCRLVRMAPGFVRGVNSLYAVSDSDEVGFADGFPFLLLSEESLEDLNGRLETPLPMNRFRPNIVLKGSDIPYMEDQIKQFQLGEITFSAVKPCARCPITCTDQDNASVSKEPLRTLATFRHAQNGGVLFGQNLIHENRGTIRTGDKLTVIQTKNPRV
ncbi:MOSC N-terminal beta barrel domain-containing protein [Candidatus Chlorohelix sp.]|uniref:MOSC domain-containing protein n=1 Tax=Candidatus Chlorohelix sp. TaxID=3139201 RepID=UPI00302C8CFE